ncbi:MAG: leucine-rich repeat domain-containing protein [Oscillospiraceae bacterium]|nr:leucine-rich repeat domain-containing protein [Oscillospiraceae bacterium]
METKITYHVEDKILWDCSGFDDVLIIPDNVVGIGDGSFQNLTIKKLVLGKNLKHIGDRAFEGCWKLTEIVWNDKIKGIGWGAFKGCWNLKKLCFPQTVESVFDNAFAGCKYLKTVEFPRKLKYLGTGAFADSSVDVVTIPASVSFVGNDVFRDYPKTNFIIEFTNQANKCRTKDWGVDWWGLSMIHKPNISYLRIKGDFLLHEFDDSEIIGYRGNGGVLEFPDKIRRIAPRAFKKNKNITRIVFNNSLMQIGEAAFSSCVALESVVFNKGAWKIGINAFSNCPNLKEVIFNEAPSYDMGEIKSYAFESFSNFV